ncbi:zinc ribbon domain-containing protein [bacterium]|nr:zinc ribbon domain-containing protein [bacterium]
MAEHCPRCNFLNPYGAQICGECGHTLIEHEIRSREIKKTASTPHHTGIRWTSIGLRRADHDAPSAKIIALSLCIFAYGLFVTIVSIFIWFKPLHGLGFICRPDNLYPLLAGVFFGGLTITISYGFYRQGQWVFRGYVFWVGLQILVMFLSIAGIWMPWWLGIKAQIVLSIIILVEILSIPFVLRIRRLSSQKG